RGLNSINSSSAATILLDGTTVNESVLSSLSPNQVKRISVIKDGSAAIYGFKGSNGVLIIETKMGNRVHD
ncbi:MAG: TonB-dependent receptor plug domain-containing protein, partial [Draconibacterium sp.]|nr:TonB-dependent receptor plug domain-containing protein [Draconibacterium sp.]